MGTHLSNWPRVSFSLSVPGFLYYRRDMTAVWRMLRLEKDLWSLVWLRSRWDFPGESGGWWLSVEAQLRSGLFARWHIHIVTVQQSVTSHYFSRATPMGLAFIALTKQWQKKKKKIETEASQGTWPKGCTVCFMSFASWYVWQTSSPRINQNPQNA